MYRSFAALRMTRLRFVVILNEVKDLFEMGIPPYQQNASLKYMPSPAVHSSLLIPHSSLLIPHS